ncbi:nucleotidyltransferase domain-containing protein [Streptomyces sp. NPDC020965]|uniref:nucleotidyltransferase domain-containing protein n=1 Tax=Streptomyces sp. NPDC020965 TaxID=3365105 RepID=UPI0037BB792E
MFPAPSSPSPAPSFPYHSPAADALDRRVRRLREIAEAEPRLDGVLLYGSWTLGEADAHSDIEAYLFVREGHAETFDGREFIERLAPLELAYTNMYGILAVVFDDLMRGEFHFEPADPGIESVADWRGSVHLPDPEAAVLLDRSGRLTQVVRTLAEFRPPEAPATALQLTSELANWTLMLSHVLARGETARAHALLHTVVAPLQLQLCRLLRGSTAHWLTPSRALEADLPAPDRERYAATTARCHPDDVPAAARKSWEWSRELAREAADRWEFDVPSALHGRIAAHLAG